MLKFMCILSGGDKMISNHPLRTLAASKLFMLGCIILSVNALTTGVYTFFAMRASIPEMLNEILNTSLSFSPDTLAQAKETIKYIAPISLASSVVFSFILSSIPAFSLWLTYFSARSATANLKTIGFSILNVYLLVSVFSVGYNLVLNIFGSISGGFFSVVASSLEDLMNLAMLISARKLLFAAKEIAKTGNTRFTIDNRCAILILINLCVAAGTLILQITANVYPQPTGQMLQYVFSDLPSLITGLAVSIVSIGEYSVFFFLCRKGISALTCNILPPEETSII